MKFLSTNEAKIFLEKTHCILEKDEINGSLIYGIANKVLKNKNAYGDNEPCFFIGYDEEEISFIALITPPYKLFLYGSFNENIITAFVGEIKSMGILIPGVTGENKLTEYFVRNG
jgi:hypothetical protein